MIEIQMKVGAKGQVVIPQVFRKSLKIHPQSEIIFKMEGKRLILEIPKKDSVEIFRSIAKSGKSFKGNMHPHDAYDEELEERLG